MKSSAGTILLLLLSLLGCSLPIAPPKATSVSVQATAFPHLDWSNVSKVVVLPFTLDNAVPRHAELMQAELVQALRQRFQGRFASISELELGRGAPRLIDWSNQVPTETLIQVHRDFGADAAMFGTLTFSRAYGDPAFGVRLAMIDARDASLLWFAEDVIDSHDPIVRQALEGFWEAQNAHDFETLEDATYVPMGTFARFVANSVAESFVLPNQHSNAEFSKSPLSDS